MDALNLLRNTETVQKQQGVQPTGAPTTVAANVVPAVGAAIASAAAAPLAAAVAPVILTTTNNIVGSVGMSGGSITYTNLGKVYENHFTK